MRREMLFSIAVTRSNRCSSIPVEVERSSKRAVVGSTRSIRRVPQRAHNSSPSSLAVLQRWQKIFPLTFAIAHRKLNQPQSRREGKGQKAKIKSEDDEQRGFRLPLLPFAFCLLSSY